MKELLMNAVVIAVAVMLILSLLRINVVFGLIIGALSGGIFNQLVTKKVIFIVNQNGVLEEKVITFSMALQSTVQSFEAGLSGGAKIALSYALLGAFATAISHSGLPMAFANYMSSKIDNEAKNIRLNSAYKIKWIMLSILLIMGVVSQNLVPIHIAFIPLIIPPLLVVMNKISLDRRAVACVLTFGLVTTYMYLPYGFGEIFLKQILLGNIEKSGMDISGVNVMNAMGIPALGMVAGLLIALFITYRKPRIYKQSGNLASKANENKEIKISPKRIIVSIFAIIVSFAIQLYTDSMMMGALVGFGIFMATGVVKWNEADSVFVKGLRMMAMIGFIMIVAQGFAEVIRETGEVISLVEATRDIFSGSKALAAFVMLLVGLLVTMGIGSSFSTVPILTAIYVPLCMSLGFSTLATVSIIGTAGAIGDAGSPASDSTLGPTSGLNVDGEHDHIKDTVIPTFLHFNIPLLIAGWIAAMVL